MTHMRYDLKGTIIICFLVVTVNHVPHVAHIQLVPKIPTSGIPIVNSTTSIHLLVVRSYVVVVRVIILPDSSRRK